jgi:hypothetical protein
MYNGQRLIRQALDSVLGQTYESLEVIISITLQLIRPGRSTWSTRPGINVFSTTVTLSIFA